MNKTSLLEKINQASIKFLIPLSAQEMYKIIVDEAMKMVKGDLGSLFLLHNRHLVRVYATHDFLFKNRVRKNGYTYKATHLKQPYILNNARIQDLHPLVKKLHIKSTIFIPLRYKNKSIGVLSIDSFKRQTDKHDELKFMMLYGAIASLAIRKTHSYLEMKNALEARDTFISMAAHELRTPLTTMYGYIQLLQRKLTATESVENRWIQLIAVEAIKEMHLINKLLEINRINAGKSDYLWQEVNLDAVIQNTIALYSALHAEAKISFENKVQHPVTVIADEEKLEQAFSNIIENAIKFSASNPHVILQLEENQKMYTLKVIDSGTGIYEKDLPRIFESFYKGINSLEQGMGLGLFLAKNIINNHHGEIQIKSAVNKGTEVEISFPKIIE